MNPIVKAMCELLGRFADKDHPALTQPPLLGKVVKGTGVSVHTRNDRPELRRLSFIMTLHKHSPLEVSKQVNIDFDLTKAADTREMLDHRDMTWFVVGENYVQSTIAQTEKVKVMFAEALRRNEEGVLDIH